MARTWYRAAQRRARPQADHRFPLCTRRDHFRAPGNEGAKRGLPWLRQRSAQIPESAAGVGGTLDMLERERRRAEIREAEREVESGHYIRHEDMKAWLLSWGTKH